MITRENLIFTNDTDHLFEQLLNSAEHPTTTCIFCRYAKKLGLNTRGCYVAVALSILILFLIIVIIAMAACWPGNHHHHHHLFILTELVCWLLQELFALSCASFSIFTQPNTTLLLIGTTNVAHNSTQQFQL